MRSTPVIAYVALGSNLGDRAGNIANALRRMQASDGIHVEQVSRNYETPAVGGPAGSPDFLNAAARVQTTLNPDPLLRRLLSIERAMGRQRRQKWEPRIIDLDLLLYGDETISQPDLIVPHPLLHERRFVLEPLAEIAPEVIHPVLRLPIRTLLENLDRPR
jgi:2-amino-4-hydroxy-6-hydroxymethyldihydropteridine diphosphokinase